MITSPSPAGSALESTPSACCVETRSFSTRRAAAAYRTVTWLLPSGRGTRGAVLADRGEALGEPVGECTGIGISSSSRRTRTRTSSPGRRPRRQQLVVLAADSGLVGLVHPLGDVRGLLVDRVRGRRCGRSCSRSRRGRSRCRGSSRGRSPARRARRRSRSRPRRPPSRCRPGSRRRRGPPGPPARTASRTPSEIASATLSGWPSVTDSEVKRYSPSASGLVSGMREA